MYYILNAILVSITRLIGTLQSGTTFSIEATFIPGHYSSFLHLCREIMTSLLALTLSVAFSSIRDILESAVIIAGWPALAAWWSAVAPVQSVASPFNDSTASERYSTTWMLLPRAAHIKRVCCFCGGKQKLTLRIESCAIVDSFFVPREFLSLPAHAKKINYFFFFTLFIADTLAPALINIFTASLCPYRAAMCKGRMPNLKHCERN